MIYKIKTKATANFSHRDHRDLREKHKATAKTDRTQSKNEDTEGNYGQKQRLGGLKSVFVGNYAATGKGIAENCGWGIRLWRKR
jgi:hypothetical protein